MLDEEESLEIMKAAWDRGINTFDTANVCSNGVSEKLIANFIEKLLTFFSSHSSTFNRRKERFIALTGDSDRVTDSDSAVLRIAARGRF